MSNNTTIKSGSLILSFDDRNFEGWVKAIPLFDKYNAHATFFVSGAIDEEAIPPLKELAAHGHSIGLHGLRHANADIAIAEQGADRYYEEEIVPQLNAAEKAGIKITSFAYPNCRRTDESDNLLLSRAFSHVRGGLGLAPYDPEGTKQEGRGLISTDDRAFFPASELPTRRRLDTILLGDAYHVALDDILSAIRRAAEKNEVLVLASHNIAPEATHINLRTSWLEAILQEAQTNNLPVLGFDEVGSWKFEV